MNRLSHILGVLMLVASLGGCGESSEPLEDEPAVVEATPAEGLMFASSAEDIVMKEAPKSSVFAEAEKAAATKASEKRKTAPRAGGSGSGDSVEAVSALTADQVKAVVKAKTPQVRACYERELKKHDGLRGTVVVGWTIGASGTVSGARAVRNSTRNSEMIPCMTRAISKWRFPRAKESFDVEYPFVFRPRDW